VDPGQSGPPAPAVPEENVGDQWERMFTGWTCAVVAAIIAIINTVLLCAVTRAVRKVVNLT